MIAQSFGLSTAVISGNAGTAEYMSAIKTAVMPVVEEYQAALDRALLLESEKRAGYYFVLDAGELLKGDMVSRFNAYSTALQNNIMSIDEVRYRENLPPLDFNYMKLGLADVLYNPHTGQLITPNTGLVQDANASLTKQLQSTLDPQGGIIEEERARHWIKGEHGYFAGSYSDGNGSAGGLTKGGGGGIMKVGSGDVALEYQRYGRNKSTVINNSYIDGGEYRRKFDNATNTPEVNKTLYECAKTALKHRSGTLYEDMYWIDGETGKVILSITNSTDERAIVYTEKIRSTIKKHSEIITIHTHPSSMPPSIDDFNSCFNNGYRMGIIACHNGRLFKYSSSQSISKALYNLYIGDYLENGYEEFDAQLKALQKLKENHMIDFEEVLSHD